MSRSTTVDVYVALDHGVMLCSTSGFAADSVFLASGVNEDVSRDKMEEWLARNRNLAAVKRGQIRIINSDKLAVDSSQRK